MSVSFTHIGTHPAGIVNVGPHTGAPLTISGSTTNGILLGVEEVRTTPKDRARKDVLQWTKRRPKRVTRGTYYFIEDNTIPDGQVLLQEFKTGHGEARCSAPTRHIVDSNETARREVIAGYSKARAQMPASVMVDVSRWSPSYTRDMRRSVDPMVQLRDGVDDLLADLMRVKGEVDTYRATELVAQYGRLRDRMAVCRAEFAAIEDAFELMQEKLVAVMGGSE